MLEIANDKQGSYAPSATMTRSSRARSRRWSTFRCPPIAPDGSARCGAASEQCGHSIRHNLRETGIVPPSLTLDR